MCPHLTYSATSRTTKAPTHAAIAHRAWYQVGTTNVKRKSHIPGRVTWPSMSTSSRREQHRCGSMRWCSCSVCASLGALLLLPRVEEAGLDAL